MEPFAFTTDKVKNLLEMERFTQAAARWKPPEFNVKQHRRTCFYLGLQQDELREELKKRFPETHRTMTPLTLPITRHLVDEQARVFVDSSTFDLALDDEPLDPESEQVKWWEEFKESTGWMHRLITTNRRTRLHRSYFAKVERIEDKRRIVLFAPNLVDVVPDPSDPTDLDKAFGVRLRIAGDGGPYALGEHATWEYWCARDGAATHFQVRGDGTLIENAGNADNSNPYEDDDGEPIVPIVCFLDGPEEDGLFTLAGEDVIESNLAHNVAMTNRHNIAENQGFGELFFQKAPGAGSMPGKIPRGPTKAIELPEGVTPVMLHGAPILGEMSKMDESDLKQIAVLNKIPPGSVATEGRAVSSGVALTIERLPLSEMRRDQIEAYRKPIARLWDIIRTVHNHFAEEDKLPKFDVGVELQWHPGDLSISVDPQVELDQDLVKLVNNMISIDEIIAKQRGLSEAEAHALYEKIVKANQAHAANQQAKQFALAGGLAATGRVANSIFKTEEAQSKIQTPGQQAGIAQPPTGPAGQAGGGGMAMGGVAAGETSFRVGDKVRVKGKPHMPGQSTGTIALVEGNAYGIVFDGMEKMGIHRWYVASELELIRAATPPR